MYGWRPQLSWRYTIREARRRPGRTLLTVVGVVLGVAAVTAVQTSIDGTRAGYAGLFAPLAGRADLEVTPPDGRGTFAADLAALQRLPGVRAAVPLVRASAALPGPDGPAGLLVLGIDPGRDATVRDYRLVAGRGLDEADGLLLEAGFARRHGLAVGDTARLLRARRPAEVPVVGLLAALGPARFHGGAVAFLRLGRAQELFAAPGQVHAVQLMLTPGADREAIRTALPGAAVGPPATTSALATEFLIALEQPLRALSAIALICGALVILNTFLMSLGERRRQLALLRALGATRRQVVGLLLRQALLLGGVGTAVGLPLGLLLAAGLLRCNAWYLAVPLPFAVSWPAVAVGAVLGPLTAIAATLVPARRAAGREPLAGISARGGADPPVAAWPVWLGAALVGGVLVFEVAIVRGWLPQRAALAVLPVAAAGALVGCALLLPPLTPWLLAAVAPLARRLLGVEGRLAVGHLRRHRARTGLTVGVLFAAVVASVAFGQSFLNNLRDIQRWYRHTVDADFLVRAAPPDIALVVAPPGLPADAAADVRRLSGCAAVFRLRFVPVRLAGQDALLFARDFPAGRPLPLLVADGDAEAALARLRAGEVAVAAPLARRLGVTAGDRLELPTPVGPRELRVAAVVKEYGVGGMVLFADWGHAASWLGFTEPHTIGAVALPDEADKLHAAMADYCADRGLMLQPNADFELVIQRVVDGALALVGGLLVLIGLVAAVGVTNTLSTNVLEQTRELGVLRALGLKRSQLRRLVVAQAVTLAVLSCGPGAVLGLGLAFLMNRATPGLLGQSVPFAVEGWYLVACVLAVTALAVIAALVPAQRAARLPVIEALRYE